MLELERIYWTRVALRLAYAAATVWLAAAVVFSFHPNTVHTTFGTSGPSVSDILRGMFDGVLAAAAAPALVILALVVTALIIRFRDVRRRDPVRRFTRQERREGMARAGGQCEMEAGFSRRCSRPAEHGDHFYPWSKGGSTSLQNFVAACSRCNRAKGARIPSPAQQARLERRRMAYVLSEDAVRVGERRELP
ncbi:HNH endonuclease signature motif containing protein [Arthrobacter globiformis]|uniref:HNH endonuclease n=1 Tax=Arthrobacter globiformis TaxID=1665 RepID=UPI00397C4799